MSDETRRTDGADDDATIAQPNMGVVGHLIATFMNGERSELALYAVPDIIVVGRGTACDWRLDDASLSRRHAQFRWNGRELTVEDLGSANGTRVRGKAARTATNVEQQDPVQLGTVVIAWAAYRASDDADNSDAEATNLIAPPELPDPAQLTPSRGTAHPTRRPPNPSAPKAPVFVPSRDVARADEPTSEFDLALALAPIPDKAIDATALKRRLTLAWTTNRRPFYLIGATLCMALFLGGYSLWEARSRRDDLFPSDSTDKTGKPVVIQLQVPDLAEPVAVKEPEPVAPPTAVEPAAPTAVPTAVPTVVPTAEERLANAISAYDQGHLPEALGYFRSIATSDPRDEAARYMVDLIESKMKGGR